MDDWQLIESYAREKSEAAFKTLVERYAGLVYASALRQIGDATLAQDVAQAVFILLARKAGGLRRGVVLSGWLFQTTRFVASRAVRSEQRRQVREQEAFDMQQLTSHDDAWRRMTPVIDEALDHLHRPDRDAILLRYVEGRSLREVGHSLGITEEAAKKRVARAVEKLRQTLVRNGVALSVTAMATALTCHANAAVPAALIASLSANSLAATGASAMAVGLAGEVVAAWRWTKLKWAGLATLALLLCITAPLLRNATKLNQPGQAEPMPGERAALARAQTNVRTGNTDGEPIPASPANERAFRLHVVSADDSTPVANARVAFNYVLTREFWTNRFDLRTDTGGMCLISFPFDTARIDVGVVMDGWAARYATWPSEGLPGIASEYTLRLERVTNFVGGVVLDPQSRPLADVQIQFQSFDSGDASARERRRERFGFLTTLAVARTDAQGRWAIGFIPARHRGLALHARHADFPDTSIISILPEPYDTNPDVEKVKRLWNRELVTTMNSAFALEGTVVDEQGAPVAGAKIQHNTETEIFETDGAGRFRVPRLASGEWKFTATAEGFAPVRTNVTIGATMSPLLITLQTGALLRVRVVDEFGAEVVGATVGMEQWGENRHDIGWNAITDREGRIEWRSAPRAVPLELYARGDGYCYTRDIRVSANGEEHLIRLRHSLDVYGRVVDAESGFGVRDLKAVPGYGGSDRLSNSEDRWDLGDTVRGTNGQFKITFNENHFPWLLRVSADGYEDWISRPLTNFQSVVLDIAMKKARFEEGVRGVVELPDGTPAVGATVGLLTFENNFTLRKKSLDGNNRWLKTAGARGEFAFVVNRLAHSVVAVGESGFALMRVPDAREPVTLRLQPWGRVEGDVDASARQDPIEELRLYDPVTMNYQGQVSLLGSYIAKPDAQLRFTFENVPAGEYVVGINSGVGIPFHHLTATQVAPGETTRITIRDGAGARVRGRVKAQPGERLLNKEVHIWLSPETEPLPYQRLRGEEQQRAALEFWTAPAGRDYWKHQQSFTMYPAADGSFTFRDRIPPGKYKFAATSKAGSTSTNIVVSEESQPDINLGELQLR